MTEVFRRQVGNEITYLANLDNPPRKLKAVWTMDVEQDLRASINESVAQGLLEDLRRELLTDLDIDDLDIDESQSVNWKKEGF